MNRFEILVLDDSVDETLVITFKVNQKTMDNTTPKDMIDNSSFDKVFIGAPLINGTVVEQQSLFLVGENAEFAIRNLIAATKQSHLLVKNLRLFCQV